jgi:hypothetical protein
VCCVPYGKDIIEFDLLPGMCGSVIEPWPVEALADVDGAIAEAPALATDELGLDLDVLVVPHALLTLPVISGAAGV